MENNEPLTYLVNVSTGEIENELYQGDRFTIRKYAQDEYMSNHIVDFNRGRSFVKVYDEVVPLLEKYLTPAEFKFVICLMPHVSYEDCIIRQTQDRNSKILNLKELAELHGYRHDYVRKMISSLKRKGIVGKHETGNILKNYKGNTNVAYTVNPYIYFRGSDINYTTYSFYNNSGWKELLSGEVSAES